MWLGFNQSFSSQNLVCRSLTPSNYFQGRHRFVIPQIFGSSAVANAFTSHNFSDVDVTNIAVCLSNRSTLVCYIENAVQFSRPEFLLVSCRIVRTGITQTLIASGSSMSCFVVTVHSAFVMPTHYSDRLAPGRPFLFG